MKNYPLVSEYMAKKLITFSPDSDIHSAIDTMLKFKISGAPVINHQKELMGVLSEVDCMRLIVNAYYDNQPTAQTKVKDFMSHTVTTIDAKATILEAAQMFINAKFKRLPVVENGVLVGQISRTDVLRAIQKIGATHMNHIPDTWKVRAPMV
jgi:predicted transcriptional regulator